MKIEVKRYSFFKSSEGNNLRYTECSPFVECEDHQICNCTKNVKIKPEGAPFQISTSVSLSSDIDGKEMILEKNDRNYNYTIKWDDKELERPHAYFFHLKDGFKIEISKKGYGLVDCFFGNLYFGNTVDTSKLMNGHAPSKLTGLSFLKPQDVWVYDCCWGNEAAKIFEDSEERRNWWLFKEESDYLNKVLNPFLNSKFSVNTCRGLIEKAFLFTKVLKVFSFLQSILLNLNETQFYKNCTHVYKESHKEKT